MFSDGNGGLSFGGALIAVIVGGWFSSLLSPLLSGFAPFLGSFATNYGWVLLGAAFGGIGVKVAISLFGDQISYPAAALALLVGNVIGFEVPKLVFLHGGSTLGPFMGGLGLFWSLPGLLISALIIQTSAHGPSRSPSA